jgi:hypothetical protein
MPVVGVAIGALGPLRVLVDGVDVTPVAPKELADAELACGLHRQWVTQLETTANREEHVDDVPAAV